MFQAGKSIEQIATERELTTGTIEGHLAHFVASGQLDILKIIDLDKVAVISAFFTSNPSATSTEAKTHFGEKYTYSELKMVLAHLQQPRPSRHR